MLDAHKTGFLSINNMFKFVLLNIELRRGARPKSSGYPFKIVVVLHQKIDFVFGVLDLAIVFSSDIKSIFGTIDVDVVSEIWVLLTQGGEDGCQMQNIINLIILDKCFILLLIGDIQLFILA